MRNYRLGLLLCVLALPALARADSISPGSFSATLDVAESVTITKTVTVTNAPPTSAKVDVFFLTDSTGSMGGLINSVKSSASQILTNTASLGDVAFGVGEYRDIFDAFTYRTNTALTTNQAAAQAGINAWGASGGGDFFEANLFALEQVATTTAWRSGSTRVLVWFGDAPGHDPRAGSTEASATAALTGANMIVEALDLSNLDLTGQATRITNATGGTLFSGVSTGNIVSVIQTALAAAFSTYSEVSLDLSGAPAGVSVSASPASHTGSFDRSVTRTFDFDVTFTGDAAGSYNFAINGLVDGGIVASETDDITVLSGGIVPPPIPEPATLALLGAGLGGIALLRRRRRRRA